MSSELKRENTDESNQYNHGNYYSRNQHPSDLNKDSKVNLNDLVNRLKSEKKKERKNNLIISAAAVSAVTVFGIILTL
tara:strand:+ start:162 stop:395 length:234 start_codon:yes stop_codon:yes gene_type:complete